MFAVGAGTGLEYASQVNSKVVPNPDPNNPVIAESGDLTEKDQFMRLIIEQIKNQDPLNPMQSYEFTMQLASMNSLQQLISMNQLMEESLQSNQLSEASALLGRYVEGMDANSEFITGVVEHVEMVDGSATLKLGDKLLLLNQVILVSDPADTSNGGDGA